MTTQPAGSVRPPRPFGWPEDKEEPIGDVAGLTIDVPVPASPEGRHVARLVGSNVGTEVLVRDGYVPVGGSALAIPERYSATVDDPRWPVCHLEVTVENGAPRCSALRCDRRQGEPPITTQVLARLPIEQFLMKSAALATIRCG